MKKIIIILLLTSIILNCKESKKVEQNNKKMDIEKKIDYPYEFIKFKVEDNNRMELYSFNGNINEDNLKEFCLEKKRDWKNGLFLFLVFFDNKENVMLPDSPLTASYGIEENKMKHIKAYYIYNSSNGFSELDIYEKSMWDSTPKKFKI